MSSFTERRFNDDTAAREYLEQTLWDEGPICSHCGVVNRAYKTKKPGVYRCASKGCRKDFTVTMGTVMHRSHIALHKWVLAFHLICSSKKGFSAHQLHRIMGITYRSAWFMHHRIREAMRAGGLEPPLGGEGQIVEADETYHGRTETLKPSPIGLHRLNGCCRCARCNGSFINQGCGRDIFAPVAAPQNRSDLGQGASNRHQS